MWKGSQLGLFGPDYPYSFQPGPLGLNPLYRGGGRLATSGDTEGSLDTRKEPYGLSRGPKRFFGSQGRYPPKTQRDPGPL